MKTFACLAVALCGAGLLFASPSGETTAEGPRELTIWEGLWHNASVSVTNLAETPLYQEVMRRTGIDVTFIHPAQGQDREAFNLMIASNDPAGHDLHEVANRVPRRSGEGDLGRRYHPPE